MLPYPIDYSVLHAAMIPVMAIAVGVFLSVCCDIVMRRRVFPRT